MRARLVPAVLITGAVIIAAWIVVTNVHHWGDWIVLGVLIMGTLGAGLAVYQPRYPIKKRTFIKTSKPRR